MRRLLPFDLAHLGVAEFLWLFVFFAALSVLAPPGRWRLWAALATALVAAGFGALLPAESVSLGRRIGALPALAGGAVFAGLGAPLLGRLALPAVLVASAALRPFGLGITSHGAEWTFLLLLWCGLAAATPVARRWLSAKAVGTRTAIASGAGFVLFCSVTHPFGLGLPAAGGITLCLWLSYAVLAQGREMRRYVARRLVGMPVVLLVLLTASFFLIRTAPGGPFSRERNTAPEIEAEINRYYGFDLPLWRQYGRFIKNLAVEGDLGPSTKQLGRSVNEIIARHLPPSVGLGLASFALAIVLGVTAGVVAGIRRNSVFDYASMTGAMLGLALPTFVVGPLLVLVFSMKLDWFRVAGWDAFPRDLILPALTLSLPFAARAARLTRAGMLEVVHQDYIRTARAKGLSETTIVLRHTLKGGLLPVVSFFGPALATIVTGSLVVETVFAVPGLGKEFVQSATNRDYGLTLGLVLVFGFLIVFFNMIVDVAYGFLDPRIRHG